MLSPDQPGNNFLSVVCQTFDFNHPPEVTRMKYSLALAIPFVRNCFKQRRHVT